jgi:hypothetical protein
MAFGSGVSGGVAGSGGGVPSTNPLPGLTQRVAGEVLSGHRAVWIGSDDRFWIANPTLDACVDMICGITTGSANPGETAYARFTGELVDPSFNFTPGPVFLGPGGTLTQNHPTSGNLVLLGNAAGPTTLHVRIEFVCNLTA